MAEHREANWRYRENQDSEFAELEIGDLSLLAQDCDGDFARWDVRRGDKYLAAGEVQGDEDPNLYHFDVAKERALVFARAIVEAEKLNSFGDCPHCKGQAGNTDCERCFGFGWASGVKPAPSTDKLVEALAELVEAFDSGALEMNSAEIGSDETLGCPPHPWHEEWLHNARRVLNERGNG